MQHDDIRLSVAEWCFFKGQYEPGDYYRRLREMGYEGVEMVDPRRYAAAKATGLRLVNLSSDMKGLNRKEDHPEALAKLRETIGAAAEQGIEQVIVFSGNREGQPDDVGIDHCSASLREVAPDAERAGVVLTLEVFNRYDHPDYQADHSAYAFEVVRRVGSPAVKVLYDLYHMHRMGEEVAAVVCENLAWIGHLHVAGCPGRDFPGGEQSLDYADAVRRIRAAGYRGLWGMEFVPKGDALDELSRAGVLFRGYADADSV